MINVLSGGDSMRHLSIFASASLTREYGQLLNFLASVLPGFVMFLIHSKVLSENFKPANLKISLAVSSGRAAMSRYKISLYLCLRTSSSVLPNSMLSVMGLQKFRTFSSKFGSLNSGNHLSLILEFILALGSRTTCNIRISASIARSEISGRRLNNLPSGNLSESALTTVLSYFCLLFLIKYSAKASAGKHHVGFVLNMIQALFLRRSI